MSVARHVRAIALLPGVAGVLAPALIVIGEGTSIGWGFDGATAALPIAVGTLLIAAGLALWASTVRLLARVGEGTLAPWDPTRRLVVEGPYRYVRNPMITAVMVVLLGQAALLGSLGVLIWCAVLFAINWAFFVAYEEPALARRFGAPYSAYRANVPRWIPRRHPWTPASEDLAESPRLG
jgi:protein-S-isoprenylcysteine O-methyltransferase Ste14